MNYNDHFELSISNDRLKNGIRHGTTTLAFKYKDGIIIAVDSRATAGAFIASQTVKKIIEINPYLLGTMAGGAADCSFWERNLSRVCRLYELQNKKLITVSSASKILSNMVISYKGRGLSMGTMVAGVDRYGFHIFYIDSDGSRIEGNLFAVGSGSTFAYGVLDSSYKFDMSYEDALDLAKKAIVHATHRDAYSGGSVRVYSISQNGWKVEEVTDVMKYVDFVTSN